MIKQIWRPIRIRTSRIFNYILYFNLKYSNRFVNHEPLFICYQLLSIAFGCLGDFLLIWIITFKPIVSKNFFKSISGHRVWIKNVIKEVFQKLWWVTLTILPERLKVLVVNEKLIELRRRLFYTSESLNCEYGNKNTSCGKNISLFAIKWLIWIS
jgi:hypothetical protein